MRLLIVTGEPKLPLEDCELGSQLIQFYGRKPRANSRRIASSSWGAVVGGMLLAGVGVVLTMLLFTI